MAVTKRTRYEALRRDGHSCRYCGATAADSPLTVDHVIPVALGGDDGPDNLVAACRDCNAGKSSTSPDATLVAATSEQALKWADAIQSAASQAVSKVEDAREFCGRFFSEWESNMPMGTTLPHPDEWESTVLQFSSLGLPEELLHDAITITAQRQQVPDRAKWKYFCGICWNKIRDLQEAAAEIASADESDEGGDEDDGGPTEAEEAAWSKGWDTGYDMATKQMIRNHTASIFSGLILNAVVDNRLDLIPDNMKWSA